MNRLIAWWANNHVAANLMMIGIFLAGIIGFNSLEREMEPQVRFPGLQIMVAWPGASPQEVEEQLVARIQQSLASLPHPAQDQARQTLASYLEYKLAVSQLEDSYGGSDYTLTLDELALRMDDVQQLRRHHLDSATADAFFRADEAIDEFQLQRMAISQNDELTPDEKASRMTRPSRGSRNRCDKRGSSPVVLRPISRLREGWLMTRRRFTDTGKKCSAPKLPKNLPGSMTNSRIGSAAGRLTG
jgi:hypothetical protein